MGQGCGTIRLHTFYEPSLRLRRPDGTQARLPLQVEVIDDGPGILPDIAADIFEPFVSGRENGTGLGLALVSKLLADVGGWISVDSVPGRTVFRVSLPLAPKNVPEDAEGER
jgi:two-component system nitrogen regulation sensor histidine kinase GlnL